MFSAFFFFGGGGGVVCCRLQEKKSKNCLYLYWSCIDNSICTALVSVFCFLMFSLFDQFLSARSLPNTNPSLYQCAPTHACDVASPRSSHLPSHTQALQHRNATRIQPRMRRAKIARGEAQRNPWQATKQRMLSPKRGDRILTRKFVIDSADVATKIGEQRNMQETFSRRCKKEQR